MRYPVGDGSKETFERDWYSAQRFGAPTSYGYHEGEDFNLRAGGDSDLGQPIYAIANGRIVYWHYSGHPATGFGRHSVYRIDGPRGPRWIHQAHLSEQDFMNVAQDVSEGQMIGRIGKSGNSPLAHLHFCVYKVDPASVGTIDNVANTTAELNANWEDPIAFIDQGMTQSPITDTTRIPQIGNREVREIKAELDSLNGKINSIRTIVT